MMGWQKHEQRLDRLVAEARARQLPRLDLTSMRERLVAEFRTEVKAGALAPLRPAARGPSRRLIPSPWLAAVAACVLGVVFVWQFARTLSQDGSAPATAASAVSASNGATDGDSLELGKAVTAGGAPLRVEHTARATWVLAPGSQARVVSTSGNVLRVELARGTLDVAVVPSERSESFIVQAGGTQVSVHGTRFQVSLDGIRVRVVVTEGEVRVHPLAQPHPDTSLGAGMQAEFVDGIVRPDSLQVVSEAVAAATNETLGEAGSSVLSVAGGPATGDVSSANHRPRLPPAARQPTPSAEPPHADDSSHPEAVTESRAPEVELAVQRVSERIQTCFRQHTAGRGELSIEASTRLGLWVQPNGLILEVGLNPPLAPQVEQCVATELAGINLGASPDGYRLDREIRLSR